MNGTANFTDNGQVGSKSLKRSSNATIKRKPPFWRETWFYEQIVYVLVCLPPAAFTSWHLRKEQRPDDPATPASWAPCFGVPRAECACGGDKAKRAARPCRSFVPEVRCAPAKWIQPAGQVWGVHERQRPLRT